MNIEELSEDCGNWLMVVIGIGVADNKTVDSLSSFVVRQIKKAMDNVYVEQELKQIDVDSDMCETCHQILNDGETPCHCDVRNTCAAEVSVRKMKVLESLVSKDTNG